MSTRHVVIIGAGLAGLSAAETLARVDRSGIKITLFEAKRIAGGRAGSFTDTLTGNAVDYCQHVAMGCCTNLLGLLSRCGLERSMNRYERLQFYHPAFPVSEFSPSRFLPAPLHLAKVIGQQRYLSCSAKKQIRSAMRRLFRTPTKRLQSVTALDWLEQQNQSADAIRDFWSVILVSALGDTCDHASMAAARKVFVDGFAAAKGASDVLVPQRPLSEWLGCDLVKAIEATGIHFRSQSAVKRIVTEGPLLVGVETLAGELIKADAIISAVPWHAFGRLVDASGISEAIPNLDSIRSIPSSPITGIHLWFDRPIMTSAHAVLIGGLAQWVFRQPFEGTSNDSRNHYYQVVISGAYSISELSKDEMIDQVISELGGHFPIAKQARLEHSRIVTDPFSVFSIRPDVEAIRPCSRCERLPWLSLAGDWTATGWPSTMEGAVISGIQAASSAAQYFGFASPEPDGGLSKSWLARMLIVE
ncbi:15-cis-phytoene desaturase [Novipirellula aureliae]|uniref:15-cis-phytoene desaturase n=1 Tax=Novipirellula aureliae TaxID=2527966 RepID=A0A5C6E219_9BACT|nr:hydroxysqualene dehydroxylase HpnE [Novipirellula aureliae]TWU41426.1 15-cis-phytoene desaturase [Novipirellula aureliae]